MIISGIFSSMVLFLTVYILTRKWILANQVDGEPSVGEDAFVWLVTVVPLIADVVNGRFTFETLTATTVNRLHFPAYDKFLKETDGYYKLSLCPYT